MYPIHDPETAATPDTVSSQLVHGAGVSSAFYAQPVHDPVTHEPIVEELEVDDAVFSVIDVEPHMS